MQELTKQQQDHIGNSLIFMCRYALGRKTSADMACFNAIKNLWEFVPKQQRKIIKEEILSETQDLNAYFSLWREIVEFIEEQEK